MKLNRQITRIANFILFADKDWVSFEEARSETDAKRMLDSTEVHKTERGYGRGPAQAQETQIVPRWKKDTDFVNRITKQRPDLDAGKVYEELKGYPDSKSRKLALHWTLNKGIVSPEEDKQKVLRAIKVSELKKIDPMKYKSPLEITESFGSEVKEERMDPDTVKEFSNKRELPEGVTYYDVENSKEGQLAARKILDSHFGEDSNPWCLLYKKDGTDNPSSDAWKHWNYTYPGPKKIAFQNGRLIAFHGGGQWWDRLDHDTKGIPITSKIQNDKLGRKMLVEMDEESGELASVPTKIFKGDPNNGPYSEWHPEIKDKNGNYFLSDTGTKQNGKWNGPHSVFYATGDNHKQFEGVDKDDTPVGLFKSFWPNGEIKGVMNYSNIPHLQYRRIGKHETYYDNGQLEKRETLSSDGLENRIGNYEEYYKNGQLKEKGQVDTEGKLIPEGTLDQYNDDGSLFTTITYDNGEISGKTSYPNGKPKEWSDVEIASLNWILKKLPYVEGLRDIPNPEAIIELQEMFNRGVNGKSK